MSTGLNVFILNVLLSVMSASKEKGFGTREVRKRHALITQQLYAVITVMYWRHTRYAAGVEHGNKCSAGISGGKCLP